MAAKTLQLCPACGENPSHMFKLQAKLGYDQQEIIQF